MKNINFHGYGLALNFQETMLFLFGIEKRNLPRPYVYKEFHMQTNFERGEVPKEMPFIIHGNPFHKFPTHTHGLCMVGLPEIFIHSRAFGLENNEFMNNGDIINMAFIFLCQNNSEWDKVAQRELIDIPLGKDGFTLCLRPVDISFAGVTTSYSVSDRDCPTGFSQLYVKGEEHPLDDKYFIDEHDRCASLDDKCGCDVCKKEGQ